jgi:hypothetical protein
MSTKGENEMANGNDVKDNLRKPVEMRDASESAGSKSQQTDDDLDRVGGNIQTRSADQSGGANKTQEEDEQPAGRSSSAEDDDPVRGA